MRAYAFLCVHAADGEPHAGHDVIPYHGLGDRIRVSKAYDAVILHAGNPAALALLHLQNFSWDGAVLAGSPETDLLWAWSLPSRGTVRLRSPYLDNAEGKLRPY